MRSSERVRGCAASVIVTGVMAWTATQRAIGALQFMDSMDDITPGGGPLRDPAGCVGGNAEGTSLKDLYLREMRYSAESLAASILVSRADDSDFRILLGVADSTTFNSRTTWGALPSYQQKCYIGDMNVRVPVSPGIRMHAEPRARQCTSTVVKLGASNACRTPRPTSLRRWQPRLR